MKGSEHAGTQFRLDIQGLRAIAVLFVVVYHGGVTLLSGGFVGVDVFFVLSGFLITDHILRETTSGSFRFSSFWARRVRRLLPASWTVAVLTLVIGLLGFPQVLRQALMLDAVSTIAYVPNVRFALEGTDYLANETPSAYQHYWSLGIEEQFYVLWPLLLVTVLALGRRSTRTLWIVLCTLVIASFVAGWWATSWRQPWAFFLLPFRAWELGVGGLVALLLRQFPQIREPQPWKTPLAWIGLVAIIAAGFAMSSATPFPGWAAAVPVLGTAAVILGGTGMIGGWSPTSLLSHRVFQFLGKISYSLYLVHWPVLVLSQTIVGWHRPFDVWQTLLLAALSVPLAWLLWRFVEEPGRAHHRWWAQRNRRALLAAVVGGMLAIAVALSVVPRLSTSPITGTGIAHTVELTRDPSGPAALPQNLTPTLEATPEDVAEIYHDGCHLGVDAVEPVTCVIGTNPDAPRVVLFGDSHAATWHPALAVLARSGEITLESHTKSSCASADVTTQVNQAPYAQCDVWRAGVIEHLNSSHPDVVLFANYVEYHADYSDNWQAALERSIRSLDSDIAVLVVEDVPALDYEPIPCLSQHPDDVATCEAPASKVIHAELRDAEVAAAGATHAGYLPLHEWLCGQTCPLVQGDTVVYRDRHHLTATFARLFAPKFSAAITEALERN